MAVGAMAHPAGAQIRFEEIAKKVGLDFRLKNGASGQFSQVELMPGGVAAFDYDNDGWLDLLISNYVAWDPATEPVCGAPGKRFYCHPKEYPGLPNQLFHNNRDGTFTDVSERSGIAGQIGKGMGVAFADFDGDGFTDVFVANDSVRHFLFRNQGDGTFREIGLEAGVALRDDGAAIAGMGVDFRDFDNDGLPDLVVSGMINDGFLLFRNLGQRSLFEDFAQCRHWIDRALKLAPNSRDPHFESARLLLKTGDAAGAAKEGEIALPLHTGEVTDLQVHFLLVQAYQSGGREQDAERHAAAIRALEERERK